MRRELDLSPILLFNIQLSDLSSSERRLLSSLSLSFETKKKKKKVDS